MNPRIWLIASIISGLLSVLFFLISITEKRRAGPFGMAPASEQVVDTGNYAANAPAYSDSSSYPENSATAENTDPNTAPATTWDETPEEGFPSNLPPYDSASPDLSVRISGDMNTCWLVVPANKPNGVKPISLDGRRFEVRVGDRITLDVQGAARTSPGSSLVYEQGVSPQVPIGGLEFSIGDSGYFLTAQNRSFNARFNGLPRFRVVESGRDAYRDNQGYYTVILRRSR